MSFQSKVLYKNYIEKVENLK